jgi:flavin reductase (DIM6/NTAB) family NADH-FMN oxidoreductase RutF
MSRQPSSGSPRKIFRQASAYQYDSEHQARSKADMTEFELKQLFPKHVWKPGTLLMPVPVVLVSCGGGKSPYAPNIITVAWAGTICSDPAMLSISVRQERYSHEIICRTQEFVVNVPTAQQAKITDWCGMKSGRDVDKFAETRLTPLPATQVKCPIIADCPLNIECKVVKTIPLGTHDMFLGKIVAVSIADSLLDRRGKLATEHADLLAYAHSEYHALGRKVGSFGFSVRKRK